MRNPSDELTPAFSRGGAETGAPRMLLLSYHFPPGHATGALRWQKLVGHAAEQGWSFDVVTLHQDAISGPDLRRVADLPEGTRIFGVKPPAIRENPIMPALLRLLRTLRSFGRRQTVSSSEATAGPSTQVVSEVVMRPDIRWDLTSPGGYLRAVRASLSFRREGGWAREAQRIALKLAAKHRYAAVITCGPPHMVHLAGRAVSRRTGIPFAMDLRDPWSLVPGLFAHEASPIWHRIARNYERRCVEQASLVITNTEPLQRAMQEMYPAKRDRIVAINNGCDDEFLPASRVNGRFTVSYAGNIYIDRDPRPLFRAAARLVRDESLTPQKFGIEFIGNTDQFGGASVLALAESEGLAGFVKVHPRRPRQEALEFLSASPMLLSLPQGVDVAIPSKIFEYMQFEAWILALARRDTATELLLRDTSADVVDPDDLEGIHAVLRSRYAAFRDGERPQRVNADGRFSRRHQAARLFDSLAQVSAFASPALEQAS